MSGLREAVRNLHPKPSTFCLQYSTVTYSLNLSYMSDDWPSSFPYPPFFSLLTHQCTETQSKAEYVGNYSPRLNWFQRRWLSHQDGPPTLASLHKEVPHTGTHHHCHTRLAPISHVAPPICFIFPTRNHMCWHKIDSSFAVKYFFNHFR